MDSADGPPVTQVGRAWPHAALGGPSQRAVRWKRAAVVLAGLAALTVYLRPGLAAPHAHWPLWDVHVYWWGGGAAQPGTAWPQRRPPLSSLAGSRYPGPASRPARSGCWKAISTCSAA